MKYLNCFGALVGLIVLSRAAAVWAGDGTELRYKFSKGDRAIYRTTSEITQSQNIMGQDINTTISQEQIAIGTVEKVDAEGNGELKIRTERVKIKAGLGAAGEFSFDSRSDERDTGSIVAASVIPLLERLAGSEVQVLVGPDGEVKKVKGYAELFADLLENDPSGAEFVGGGSDEGMKLMLQDQFPRFGKQPVKVGDTWEVPYQVDTPGLGKLKGRHVYVYAGPDKVGDRATIKIDESSEVAIELDLEQGGAKVTGTLRSEHATSTIQFDPEAGQVVQAKSEMTLSGQLSVDAGGTIIPVQSSQTRNTKVELLEKLPE